MSARNFLSVWARLEVLAFCAIVIFAVVVSACGQKGPLIVAKPAATPSSAAARAPLPPPEPLEPPVRGTATR